MGQKYFWRIFFSSLTLYTSCMANGHEKRLIYLHCAIFSRPLNNTSKQGSRWQSHCFRNKVSQAGTWCTVFTNSGLFFCGCERKAFKNQVSEKTRRKCSTVSSYLSCIKAFVLHHMILHWELKSQFFMPRKSFSVITIYGIILVPTLFQKDLK